MVLSQIQKVNTILHTAIIRTVMTNKNTKATGQKLFWKDKVKTHSQSVYSSNAQVPLTQLVYDYMI